MIDEQLRARRDEGTCEARAEDIPWSAGVSESGEGVAEDDHDRSAERAGYGAIEDAGGPHPGFGRLGRGKIGWDAGGLVG